MTGLAERVAEVLAAADSPVVIEELQEVHHLSGTSGPLHVALKELEADGRAIRLGAVSASGVCWTTPDSPFAWTQTIDALDEQAATR